MCNEDDNIWMDEWSDEKNYEIYTIQKWQSVKLLKFGKSS